MKVERVEIKPSWAALALRRCAGFTELCMDERQTQNPLKTLIVSCYLQGAADVVEKYVKRARVEGTYEEER
jgi:hypothetical protein